MPPARRKPIARLSAAQARRMALAAQGFADPPGDREPDGWALRRVLDRVGLIQIDSVNVLQRAHYLPLFSRLGPYDTELLDRAAHRAPRRLFEYWGHEASLLPVATQPLLRWRMERAGDDAWGGMRRIQRERPELVERVLAGRARPRADRRQRGRRGGAPGAHRAVVGLVGRQAGVRVAVLERADHLGAAARLRAPLRPARARAAARGRRHAHALARGRPARAGADRGARAAAWRPRATCATTSACRSPRRGRASPSSWRRGELWPVEVEGWSVPGYVHPEARLPRSVRARALVGPFDSLVWERPRVERLFGFRYRIEIYVPKPKRIHGYYVLPFLLGDRLVARVDLKADRAAGVLRVQASHAEPDAPPETAAELAAELDSMAEWLGLGGVAVQPRGDLAAPLAAAA